MMARCTHTSDWWKNMVPCFGCGAMYSDEDAEQIAADSELEYAVFTAEQQAFIDHSNAVVGDDLP